MILKNNMARIIIFLCTALVLTPQLLAQDHEEEEAQTGAHGGRLLEDGDFAIELAIFEQGVPPEYRAWAERVRDMWLKDLDPTEETA